MREKIGILYLANALDAPSHLWMRRMLDWLGDQVTVLAYRGNLPGDQIKKYKSICLAGPKQFWWRALRKVGFAQRLCPTADRKLASAVADSSVTVVLVHYLTVATRFAYVWAGTTKPIFVHCHGYDVTWDLRSSSIGNLGEPSHSKDYIERVRSLSSNVRFIANSNATKRKLLKVGISEERIVTKYLGVDADVGFTKRPMKAKGVHILFLGRLLDCKGPDLVLQAFERACEMGLDGTLTLAGDGPLRLTCELLKVRSHYQDRITLVGAVDAATGAALRDKADIFTTHNCLGPISQQEEAFGVSILEAMACGLPVVTGRSGGLCEIVEDGSHGILFDPGDMESHAKALLRLACNPELRQQMGEAGWRHVRANFSIEQERKHLLSILGS